jgi:cytochrome P450
MLAKVTRYISIALLQDCGLYKAAQEITYLDNVIQESLRIYPPAVE